MTMNRDDVQAWLDRYVEAWRTYDRALIGDLFSEDVEYRFVPWEEPTHGRQAGVETWLANQDPPGSWQASWEPVALDGDVAVTRGVSRYFEPDGSPKLTYHNVFVLRFDPYGQCASFTDWFMREPEPQPEAESDHEPSGG
jgi:hypothetical protein